MNLQFDNVLGTLIKQKRASLPLTLQELSLKSGVSQSHIGRIERGERFPSAQVLRRIAKPLGFRPEELFELAGFLSANSNGDGPPASGKGTIDPLVANILAGEPVELQRAAMDIFNLLKIVAKNINNSGR